MRRVFLTGNLGKDAELKQGKSAMWFAFSPILNQRKKQKR